MNIKIIFSILLFFTYSSASYQQVRIGTIDAFYKNKINKIELKKIILDIESTIEKQLNINLFDYSKNGKDIDIIYIEPSKLKVKILKNIKKLDNYKSKITKNQESFIFKEKYIKVFRKELKHNLSTLNKEIKDLNKYIKTQNKKKVTSKEEYNHIINRIKNDNQRIKIKKKKFKKLQKEFNIYINSYNRVLNKNNSLIYKHNRLHHKTTRMQKSFKEVKGISISNKEIRIKTYYKNGKKVKEKKVKYTARKIEIYSFETLQELKAILAHEIIHLLGIKHINVKGALMNPILQKNQIKELKLTIEDMRIIKKEFNK